MIDRQRLPLYSHISLLFCECPIAPEHKGNAQKRGHKEQLDTIPLPELGSLGFRERTVPGNEAVSGLIPVHWQEAGNRPHSFPKNIHGDEYAAGKSHSKSYHIDDPVDDLLVYRKRADEECNGEGDQHHNKAVEQIIGKMRI